MEKRYFVIGIVLAFALLFCTLPAVKAATITFTFKDHDTYEKITDTYIYWGTSSSYVNTYLGRTDNNGQISKTFSQTGTIYFETSDGTYSGNAYIYSSTTSKTVYLERKITFTFYDSNYNKLTNKSIYWGISSGYVNSYLGTTDSNGQIKTSFSQTGAIYFETSDGTYSGNAYIYSSTTSKTLYMTPETTTTPTIPSATGTVAAAIVALLIVLAIIGAIIYAATRGERLPAQRPKPTPPAAARKPPAAPPEKKVVKPPLGKLESKVYRHIKRHRGVLDVAKCAKRLGASEEEVEKAAKALVAKGKLKQEE